MRWLRGERWWRREKVRTHVGSPQKGEQFATGNEVHDHVEVCCVLEAAPQINNERMLHSEQHLLFIICVIDLL